MGIGFDGGVGGFWPSGPVKFPPLKIPDGWGFLFFSGIGFQATIGRVVE